VETDIPFLLGFLLKLEDITRDQSLDGPFPDPPVTVVDARLAGDALRLVFRDSSGGLHERVLLRRDEGGLSLAEHRSTWRFSADGDLFKLVSEAYRIRMGYLFDPFLAMHTSLVEPLPHQITAVYEAMISRQPLRFLLADDPGAGKTIMAGMLIKELMIRGVVERCLIVAPGNLLEQWQDELDEKFALRFEIFTRESMEVSHSGNPFADRNLVLARLDMLSRGELYQEALTEGHEWDMVICYEAHKMAA
jgi:SNF2 family DNA or RNA helicase